MASVHGQYKIPEVVHWVRFGGQVREVSARLRTLRQRVVVLCEQDEWQSDAMNKYHVLDLAMFIMFHGLCKVVGVYLHEQFECVVHHSMNRPDADVSLETSWN